MASFIATGSFSALATLVALSSGPTFVFGALIALTVLVIALIALFLPWWASALIVFALFAGIAALTGWTGYKKLDLRGPTRTINSVKETVRWAKARLLGRSAS